MNALEVRHLTKEYKDFALKDVSFTVPKGSIVGFVGENGAGKSTTFKAILNLIKKDAGDIKFYGQKITDGAKALKEEIGVVFDSMNFGERLTPEMVGKIHEKIYKNWDNRAYEKYLKQFKLRKDKEIKNYSKGMQVKLSLAVALSHHAKFLLLDEATSGLDPVIRDEILDIFLEFIQDEEHAILISSHITSDLEKVADYIIFIHEGKIILNESKDELIYNYGVLRCGKEQFDKLEAEDVLVYRKMDYQYEVLVRNKEKMEKKYKDAVIDQAKIDEIILLYVKGVRK